MAVFEIDGVVTSDRARKVRVIKDADPIGGIAKRVFDILFSSLVLLAALPIFIIVPLVVFWVSPGPVFFVHHRSGHRGKKFPCLKFRTMVLDADAVLEKHLANSPEAREEFQNVRKLKNDPRIIPIVGSFLRKSSFDEFPQFLNVLRGEMSVVGPRPITEEELSDYGDIARRYKAARPGITGLWQVSGRNNLTMQMRAQMDSRYVKDWSFFNDAGIILRTIGVVLNWRGSY